MLIWHLCHSALPVATILNQKIPNLDPTCARCLSNHEDHIHLFRDCHYSKAFWAHVFQVFGAPHNFLLSFYSSLWLDWLSLNLDQNMKWKTIFGIVIWHLWKIRNNAVFRKCSYPHCTNFNSFLYDVHLIHSTWQGNKKDEIIQIKHTWNPPPKGLIKLNTDGSFKDNKLASGGGAFRKDNGAWLKGFSIKVRVRKPVEAELLAIKHGLEMAKELGLNKLLVEIDAKAIITMLNTVEKNLSHELGAILFEVSNLLKEVDAEISYFHRDCNTLAHVLGRYGLQMNQDIMVHDSVPEFAMRDFNNDFKACNLFADD